MRPRRLELEGFGAFRDPCTIDFSDIELVALVGATGSGKSTIIDAITFALYGSVARYDDKGAVAPVINQTSTRARVRLDFEVGAQQLTAVRLVQRTPRGATTKEARLERGDEVIAADARSMSTEVTRLLGLDVDQFNRTVVLPQGRFADFLHDQPRDRQKTLRQLLGLEMYQRIGSAVRQRAATVHSQVDALRPDLEAGERELTDEHRARLVAHLQLVQGVRVAFIESLDRLAPIGVELAALERRLADVDGHLALIAAVRPPPGVAELDQRAEATDAEVQRTVAALAEARTRHRAADAAVAASPDLARCSAQLQRRRDAAAAVAEHDATTAELAATEERCGVARRAAAHIDAAQAALDAEAASRRAAHDDARLALEAGPNPARVEHWLTLRARRAERQASAEAAAAAADDAQRAVVPLTAAAAHAEEAETEARRQREDVQQRAGAAGFVGLLEVGAPCPLCLHHVEVLPDHHVSEDLERASATLVAATGAVAAARRELRRAQRTTDELRARAEAAHRELAALDADLEGVPDDDTLTAQLARAVDLRRAAESAAAGLEAAEAASAAHRADPANTERLAVAQQAAADVARLRVLVESQAGRRDALLAELAGVPDEATLAAAIAEARRAVDACHAAAAEHHAAATAHDAATTARSEVAAELRRAAEGLLAVRDRVAVLDPPPLTGERPGADWSVLTAWATQRHAGLASARDATAAECDALAAARHSAERDARERCAAVVGSTAATGELPALRDRLTEAETSAATAITAFDERRVRLGELRGRVEGLVADGAVAEQLGHLLRADGFEAWLMQAALEDLVDAATVRLRELSSGQFSLELIEREFMVRDHANADELRSARTLSGGETFLASLSLALALADATAELSSQGSIESIFLDEGFGTLDPATLDIVATAIEELGSTGRMVAVVTHIRELADRMPVRLEVTKAGSSSSVARIET